MSISEETTLLTNDNNYINDSTGSYDATLRAVASCLTYDFGPEVAAKYFSSPLISCSDVVLLLNAYRNNARYEPHIAHIFNQCGISLI